MLGFVDLLERCQKLCKRDSFKRVVQDSFFAREMSKAVQEKVFQESCARVFFVPERCPELHQIYCCPDSCANQRFTYSMFVSFENYLK